MIVLTRTDIGGVLDYGKKIVRYIREWGIIQGWRPNCLYSEVVGVGRFPILLSLLAL